MISSGIQKMLIVLGILAVLGFIGYRIFLTELEIPADPSLAIPTTGQDILDLVAELDAIEIDQTFFTSSLFASLVDYKIPLQPEVQGRANPFAPFGVGATPASSTRVNIQLPR